MIKKSVSIWFISIASIFLLAFTILPHHHHHSNICFKSQMHASDDICDCNDHHNQMRTPGCDHENDDAKDHHFCLKDQLILLPSNNLNLKAKESIELFPVLDFQVIGILFSDQAFPQVLLPENKNGPSHERSVTFLSYFSVSSGLRAPPSA